MKKKIRTVSFYELKVETYPSEELDIVPTQSDFLSVLKPIVGFMKKRVTYGKGASAIELVDFKFTDNKLYLLINKVNPELPDIGFYKASSKTRRRPERDSDENREQSAHVLIEPKLSNNLARMKITSGAGIGAGRVQKIISDIYRYNKNSDKFIAVRKRGWPTGAVVDGQKKEYSVQHSFTVSAEPSELLSDILDKNTVLEVDLVDNSLISFDEAKLNIKKRTFTIEGKMPSNIEGLRKMISIGRGSDFEIDTSQLRIVYMEEEDDAAFEARKKGVADIDKAKYDHKKMVKKYKTINEADLEKAFTRTDLIYLDSDHSEIQMELSLEIMKGLDSL